MTPYQDQDTGVWNNLPEIRTVTEKIHCRLTDIFSNEHAAIITLYVNDYEIIVHTVVCNTSNAIDGGHDEIVNAIRADRYNRTQEIKFENV